MTKSALIDRRTFIQGAAVGTATITWPLWANADTGDDLEAIRKQIVNRHDEAVQRPQEWVRQPSIAAQTAAAMKAANS
jgi:hypothetical protein